MPKPEPKPERHGIPVCVKCKIHAVWIRSKTDLCWWCTNESTSKKGSHETSNAKRTVRPKKTESMGPT